MNRFVPELSNTLAPLNETWMTTTNQCAPANHKLKRRLKCQIREALNSKSQIREPHTSQRKGQGAKEELEPGMSSLWNFRMYLIEPRCAVYYQFRKWLIIIQTILTRLLLGVLAVKDARV